MRAAEYVDGVELERPELLHERCDATRARGLRRSRPAKPLGGERDPPRAREAQLRNGRCVDHGGSNMSRRPDAAAVKAAPRRADQTRMEASSLPLGRPVRR